MEINFEFKLVKYLGITRKINLDIVRRSKSFEVIVSWIQQVSNSLSTVLYRPGVHGGQDFTTRRNPQLFPWLLHMATKIRISLLRNPLAGNSFYVPKLHLPSRNLHYARSQLQTSVRNPPTPLSYMRNFRHQVSRQCLFLSFHEQKFEKKRKEKKERKILESVYL